MDKYSVKLRNERKMKLAGRVKEARQLEFYGDKKFSGLGEADTVSEDFHLDSDNELDEEVPQLKSLLIFRDLMDDHVWWTYVYVDQVYNGTEAYQKASFDRLLEIQKETGAVFAFHFGKEAGRKATELWTEHVVLARPVLEAAKSGDTEALEAAVSNWYVNAADLAGFLSDLNPEKWDFEKMKGVLGEHLAGTIVYADYLLKKDYPKAIKAFDEALDHMLMLGHVLAEGSPPVPRIKPFPYHEEVPEIDSYEPVSYGSEVVEFAEEKTEGGLKFGPGCYAYTPDEEAPSTWKLRLCAKPGEGPDARIVGAALAALGKGFRGNKVQIPEADLPGVKAKVLTAWKSLNPDAKDEDIPDVLK